MPRNSLDRTKFKDLTHMMFQLAIDQYEKKHGVVVPRGETPTRKDIF